MARAITKSALPESFWSFGIQVKRGAAALGGAESCWLSQVSISDGWRPASNHVTEGSSEAAGFARHRSSEPGSIPLRILAFTIQ